MLQVIAPAVLSMVADVKSLKTKLSDLTQRWEVIQLYQGLREEAGPGQWESEDPLLGQTFDRGFEERDHNQDISEEQVTKVKT